MSATSPSVREKPSVVNDWSAPSILLQYASDSSAISSSERFMVWLNMFNKVISALSSFSDSFSLESEMA